MPRPTTPITQLHHFRRWTEAQGRAAVEAWQASGLEPGRFATRARIHPVRLARWIQRLEARPTLARVEVVGEPAIAAPLEVVLPSGVVVRLGAGFDEEALRRLLRVLEPAC